MAKISKYTAATVAADADITVIVQNGITKKIALSALKTYMGAGGFQNNLSGSGPPGATNDETEGYEKGSIWIDATSIPNEAYLCADATEDTAIWLKTTLTADEISADGGDFLVMQVFS